MERAVAYLPTPLYYKSRVYCCSELGIATCLDSTTGKQIWPAALGRQFFRLARMLRQLFVLHQQRGHGPCVGNR